MTRSSFFRRCGGLPILRPIPSHGRPEAYGFSLIEVLVTVAVAAVLIGLGAPSMRLLLQRHAVAAQADALLDTLRVARSEAMKRGGPVILCKTDPRSAARATASCTRDPRIGWQTWTLFADANRSGDFDAGEPQIRTQTEPAGRLVVSSAAALYEIRFEPTGIALANTGAASVAFVVAAAAAAGEEAAGTVRRTVCVNSRGTAVAMAGGEACP